MQKTFNYLAVKASNLMRKHNITADMLLKVAGTVPSGVVEVITKQEEGWSYLKSGL